MPVQDTSVGKRRGKSFLGVVWFRNGSQAEQTFGGGFISGTFPWCLIVKSGASAFGGGSRSIFCPARPPIPLPHTVVHRLMNVSEVAGVMISRAKSLGFCNYGNPLMWPPFKLQNETENAAVRPSLDS